METTMAEHLRRRDVHCAATPLRGEDSATISWNVADNAEVDAGQTLGTAGLIERGNLHQLVAPCRGKLRIRALEDVQRDALATSAVSISDSSTTDNNNNNNNSCISSDAKEQAVDAAANNNNSTNDTANADVREAAAATVVVATVEYCIHPLKSGRTCMMCLAVVDERDEEMDSERRSVNVISHGQVLRLNIEEAKKFDSDNIRRQLSAKKLSLVLDLDHTLLHAVRVADVVDGVTKTDDMHFFYIPGMNGQQHVVKLRPGLKTFLTELAMLYDLFIYTHGTRLYAEQIARIIDPTGTFFQHRIVARTDTPDMVHKSLKLLFPSSDDSMILVLDDRIDVWKENEGNVFLIEPYHYFQCTAEINNAAGKGVGGGTSDDNSSSNDSDTHLLHATNVLKQVHTAFYDDDHSVTVEEQMAGSGRDVKVLLGDQKRSVLQGCNIVFSGVFPLSSQRGPESHYLWRLAIDLGARPSMAMRADFPITHLVIHPGRLGTQKHVQAKATPNVFIVTPEWIFKCARTWERVAESDFLADAWKAKHEKVVAAAAAEKERVAMAAAEAEQVAVVVPAAASSNDEALSKEDARASIDSVSSVGASQPAIGVDAVATDTTSDGASATSSPDTTVAAPASLKVKKSVRFAASVPDSSSNEETKENTSSSSSTAAGAGSLRQRHRPVRRVIGGSARVVGGAAVRIPEHKGVVASGGTFDFLSKITQIGAATKREPQSLDASMRSSTTGSLASTTAKGPAAGVAARSPPVKDVDDAFLRLIKAEERENAVETKRKLASDDIKDVLSARRAKKLKAAAAVGSNAGSTLARVSSDDDDDADDADLDDLEADMFDDL